MPRKAALQLVMTDLEEPPGDADLTRKRATEWTPGQKKCRRRKRHHWGRFHSIVYGPDVNRPGTRVHVIESCPDCKNRRAADHLVIAIGKNSRGLRRMEDWATIYREVNGVPYLLDKGSQAVTDELREELYAEEFFAQTGKLTYVDEEAD